MSQFQLARCSFVVLCTKVVVLSQCNVKESVAAELLQLTLCLSRGLSDFGHQLFCPVCPLGHALTYLGPEPLS
jgi:hypothetical protein